MASADRRHALSRRCWTTSTGTPASFMHVSFTLTATPAPFADLTVSVTVSVVGDFGVSAGSLTVTIPTSGSATLTIQQATAVDSHDILRRRVLFADALSRPAGAVSWVGLGHRFACIGGWHY